MSDLKIRNLFTKLPTQQLYIDHTKISQVIFLPHENRPLSTIVKEKNLFNEEYIYLAGQRKLIVRGEDVPLLISLSHDKPELIFEDIGSIIRQLGYGVVKYSDMVSYSPAGGYLYNQVKDFGKAPVLIVDDGNNSIGITTFDYIVNQLRRSLEEYY